MAVWSASVDSGVKSEVADHRGYAVDVKVRVEIKVRVRNSFVGLRIAIWVSISVWERLDS